MLAQRVSVAKAWAAAPRTAPARRSAAHTLRTVARDGSQMQLAEGDDYSPLIASGLFIAFKQGAYEATKENLRMWIAVGALVLPLVNFALAKDYQERDAGMHAPAALAAEALNILSITPAAVASFGTVLCKSVASVLNFQGAYYAAIASLAAAVYYNLGGVWTCVALLVSQGYKFYNGAKDSSYTAAPLAISLCCIYALYRYFADNCAVCAGEIAVAFVMGRIAMSVIGLAKVVGSKE